jgi:hypothetical protein
MRETDVTFVGTLLPEANGCVCLLTGRPCGLVAVTLRRMILIPPIWYGRKVVVHLPFERPPQLAVWQYLRMLRWIIVVGIGPSAAVLILRLLIPERALSSNAFCLILLPLAVLVCFGLWRLMGSFLDSREVVRLLRCDRKTGAATVRFRSPVLAAKARTLLAGGA